MNINIYFYVTTERAEFVINIGTLIMKDIVLHTITYTEN